MTAADRGAVAQSVATPCFGHIEGFDPDSDSILAYLERMDLFLEANAVPAGKTGIVSSVGCATRASRGACSLSQI